MRTFLFALVLSLLALDLSAACTRQTGLSCPAGSVAATLTGNGYSGRVGSHRRSSLLP